MADSSNEKLHEQLTIVVGIIEHGDRFLVLRRVDDEPLWHARWCLPGGKIEPGENTTQAVIRETLEETGLQIHDPELLGIYTHHWQLPKRIQQTIIVIYRADAPHDKVVVSEENDIFRWVTLEEFFLLEPHLEANLELIQAAYLPHLNARQSQA